MATYYHGSPNPDLTSLRSGSYITPDPELAKIFGRHNPETGKTWSDDDLREPYNFVGKPKFKRGSAPKGKASVYKLEAPDNEVDFLGNPYEHTIRRELPVSRFNRPMKHFSNFFSDQAEGVINEPAPAESLRLRGGRKIEYGGNSYVIGKARPSTRQGKKYEVDVIDKTNGTTKTVHWGAIGYDDYYVHKDKDRRDRFRKRMSAITTKDGKIASDDPTRSSYHALRHNW